MASSIVYRPLRKDEIRVLDLAPAGDENVELRCKLRHVRLPTAEYAALSYVWGQHPDKSAIRVKVQRPLGSSLVAILSCQWSGATSVEHIGSNLSRALRCLRRPDRSVCLWTDQLCINQDDDVEKAQQLPRMRDIYARATVVHAWLGPSAADPVSTVARVHASFDVADRIWTVAQSVRTGQLTPRTERDWLEVCFAMANNDPLLRPGEKLANLHAGTKEAGEEEKEDHRSRWTDFSTTLIDQIQAEPTIMKHISVLQDLSNVSWFSRIWILQEYGRARSLVFHHGTRRESVPHLPIFLALSLAHAMRRSPHTTHQFPDFDKRFLACLTARTTCTERIPVLEVLKAAFHSPPPTHEASDPRDLIHARLGLADDTVAYPEAITRHYVSAGQDRGNPSAGRVFASVARTLLLAGVLEPLLVFKPYAWMQGPPRHLLRPTAAPWQRALARDWRMPSWAYDWSQDGLHSFLTSASDAARGTRPPQVSFAPCAAAGPFGEALLLRGRQIGVIARRSPRFSWLVEEAALGKGAVAYGNLHTDVRPLGASSAGYEVEAAGVRARIDGAHRRLGNAPAPADIARLFEGVTRGDGDDADADAFPFARFWCWWTAWAAELKIHAEAAAASGGAPMQRQNLTALLFRAAPRALERHLAIIGAVFGTTGDLTVLTDLARWRRLLGQHHRPDGGGANDRAEMHAAGVDLAEALFASAWGMRVALLAPAGRLAYVPEDAAEGDPVAVFDGLRAPLVLRTAVAGGDEEEGDDEGGGRRRQGGGEDVWTIVGPTHVVGAMQGELIALGGEEGAGPLPEATFTLI